MVSRLHALFDERGGGVQVDKSHLAGRKIAGQQLAVWLPERRAGEDYVLTMVAVVQHTLVQGLQPRHAIGVGEWDAGCHFAPVFRRVIVVSVFELPSSASG